MKRNLKIMISMVLILCVGMSIFAGGAQEGAAAGKPEYTFKCSTNHAEGFSTSRALKYWSDKVFERTNGRIKIDIFYDAVLGDEKSIIEQLQYGGIEFGRVNISPLAEFVDGFNALMMPYVYRDDQHFWNVMGGDIGLGMLRGSDMVKTGFYGLTFYDGGTRNFYNSKREIRTPKDMVGLNIRVQESNLMIGMVRALGANATAMPYGDVYSGLQTGTIDGAENSVVQYLEVSHYEVAPFLTIDNHTRAADCLLISQQVREKLSAEDMKIIEEAAIESWDYQKKLWAESDAVALQTLKDAGVKVTTLSDAEVKQFMEACAPLADTYNGGRYKQLIAQIAAVK